MSEQLCRNCKARIKADLRICPHCGIEDPTLSLLAPFKRHLPMVIVGALVILGMIYLVVDDTSPVDRETITASSSDVDIAPPRPPTSVDSGEAQMLSKAQWSVQVLRSAKRAQMCGLRGHMWATRMEDEVFASELKDRAKFRSLTANAEEFDSYAKALRAWEMQRIQPPHPSEYDCAAMPRGSEIDMLVRAEEEVKENLH